VPKNRTRAILLDFVLRADPLSFRAQ